MLLSASIMCANLGWLAQEVIDLDAAGVDVFHVDLMDGVFVPNFALSSQDLGIVRAHTRKMVDVHLMVKNPGLYLPFVIAAGVDIIYVHLEADDAITHLREIRRNGISAGLAINPETTVEDVMPIIDSVDRLLVMRVKPGFAGQKALPEVDEKIARLADIKGKCILAIDGAVCPKVVEKWTGMGVDEFILGTSSLFGKTRSYRELVNDLRGNQIPFVGSRPAPKFPLDLGMSWLPSFSFR